MAQMGGPSEACASPSVWMVRVPRWVDVLLAASVPAIAAGCVASQPTPPSVILLVASIGLYARLLVLSRLARRAGPIAARAIVGDE